MNRSVTEILDHLTEPELLSWMLRTPKAKREAKSDDSKTIGTIVDNLIRKDLFPNTPILVELKPLAKHEEAIGNCMKAWGIFKLERPDVISGIRGIQEELIHDGIIGHPDIYFEDAVRWGIIDVKTSKTIYPKYWTQTAEYSELKRLMLRILNKPRFIGVLRLDKESGKPYYLEITDEDQIQYEVRVFESYRVTYEHAFKNREFLRQQLELEVLK